MCGEFTGTGEFLAQRASYAENVSIWWRHHGEMARIWFLPSGVIHVSLMKIFYHDVGIAAGFIDGQSEAKLNK